MRMTEVHWSSVAVFQCKVKYHMNCTSVLQFALPLFRSEHELKLRAAHS